MAFAKISTAITIYRIADNPVLRRVLTQRTASRDRYNYLALDIVIKSPNPL